MARGRDRPGHVVRALLGWLVALAGAAGSERREPTRGVQLFRNTRTHLEFTPEGAEILRNAPRPFCIVSIVGPTRTGKSALIGRCFAEPASFEVGGDLFSKTSGVWISDKPSMIEVGEGEDTRTVAVYVLDTEGFHGVLQRTTQSFEANMFAVVCLMSSVVIYNSRAPLDAKDVERLRTFATTTSIVRAELTARGLGEVEQLPKPSLVWAVQNINFRHLDAAFARMRREVSRRTTDSALTADAGVPRVAGEGVAGAGPSDEQLGALARTLLTGSPAAVHGKELEAQGDASDRDDAAGSAARATVRLAARSDDAASTERSGSLPESKEDEAAARADAPGNRRQLTGRPRQGGSEDLTSEEEEGDSGGAAISHVFRSVELHPLHAPHHDDDILADLSAVADSELSAAYLSDTRELRARCARRLTALSLGGVELSGEAFYWHLERWLLEGRVHVPEPSVAASILEAKLRRVCALLAHEFSEEVVRPRPQGHEQGQGADAGGAGAERAEWVPPHIAHAIGTGCTPARDADSTGDQGPLLDGASLALIAEPYERLAARLVIGRNDAAARFDQLCARWLHSASAGNGGIAVPGAARPPSPPWLSPQAAASIAAREKGALDGELDARMRGALAAYARAATRALDEIAAKLGSRGELALEAIRADDFVRWSTPLEQVEGGLAAAVGAVVERASAQLAAAAEYYGLRAPALDQLENTAFLKLRVARAQLEAHRAARLRLLRLLRTVRALLVFAALNALDAWRRGRWGGGPAALESPW